MIHTELYEITQQDKSWVLHFVCGSCYTMMIRLNSNQDRAKLKYTKPTKWKEPKDENDCYFYFTRVEGISKIKKQRVCYATVNTVELPEEVIVDGLENEESQNSVTTGLDALQVDDHSTNQITEEEIDSSDGQSNEKDSSESDEDEENLSLNSGEEYVPLDKERTVKRFNQKRLSDF